MSATHTRRGRGTSMRTRHLALLAALTFPSVTSAQSSAELAARRLLVERAEAARHDGHDAEALDLAQRAGQIQMTPSLRMFIASEEMQLGRLAEAFGSADLCLREVEANPAAHNHDAVRDACRGIQSDLRPRLGQLVVTPPSSPADALRVTVAGTTLTPALYGAPTVVTPGDVAVATTATGRAPWSTTVRVDAGQTASVRAELGAVIATPVTPHPPVVRSGGTQRALGWVAAGVAALAVGGGVTALLLREGAVSDHAAASCTRDDPRDVCTGALRDGDTEQALAITGFAVGGALAVTSVVLLLTAPSRPRAEVTTGMRCSPGPGVLGLACGAAF